MTDEISNLNQEILAAHSQKDKALLSKLYGQAAGVWDERGDQDQAAFYFTHAWILALETDDPDLEHYMQRLAELNRV